MTADEAHALISPYVSADVGKFYGSVNNLSLGAGLIYPDIRIPEFNVAEQLFDTFDTNVYVITHECDVDPGNVRPFSDLVLVCPVILLSDLIAEYIDEIGPTQIRAFLAAVGQRKISRVVYLPPGPQHMRHGGFIYLNNIASTHISAFDKKVPICAVSQFGLKEVDMALTNHLLRPKAEWLSGYGSGAAPMELAS